MKNIKPILFFFLLTITSFCFGQETEVSKNLKTIEITVEGMACQEGYADAINLRLSQIKGVDESSVSYESGKASITYNPFMVTIDSLKNTITSTKVKNYNYVIKSIKNEK